jgi:putative transposase
VGRFTSDRTTKERNKEYKQDMFGMWIIVQIEHGRILHCDKCGLTIDRDINASINISKRGRTWLKRSQPNEGLKGPSSEAMIQSKDGEQMMVSRIPR